MAILKIARMGHPVLQSPARPVEDPTAPEIARLVRDMMETLADIGGLGLAAPQIHVPLRLVIFHIPPERARDEPAEETDGPQPMTILINPEIEPLSEELELEWESCLSLPGLMGEVPRLAHLRYRGLGLDGGAIERQASGFHARVVQHECDHLDGVLYPMRMTDMSRFGFAEDIRRRFMAEDEAGEDEEEAEAAAGAGEG